MKSAVLDAPVDRYVFAKERARIVFSDRTKNIGRGTAYPSRNRFYLGRTRAGPYIIGPGRGVPELLPHESNKGSGESNSKLWPYEYIGTYYPSVCADTRPRRVKERNERNNCFEMAKRFSVIPRKWTGTITGTAHPYSEPGITESWDGEVTFVFDQPLGDTGSGFRYKVESASLTYEISGADKQGCTYSGGPALLFWGGGGPASLLYLDGRPSYFAAATISGTSLRYSITVHCPGDEHPSTQDGPIIHDQDFLFTNPFIKVKPAFGYRSLKGKFTSTVNWPIAYTWDLHAE